MVFLVSGPAKVTWQSTHTAKQKADRKSIVKIFLGQYGVHVNRFTAYQRCSELHYDQLGSAQGLLNAIHEYQRMAPKKFNDSILRSILWYKVPIQ